MVKEDVIKHLEFVQNVITRMANNSFLLRGWAVTLVAALSALAAQNTNITFVLVAFIPIIAFWILDGYYLRQERLFRELYKDICKKTEEEIKLIGAFSMDTTGYKKNVASWFRTLFSITTSLFYGSITAAVIFVIIAIKLIN